MYRFNSNNMLGQQRGFYEKASVKEEFYRNFKEINPVVIIIAIIFSFGLYIINWMYKKNKEMYKANVDVPEPNRCAFTLMILPVTWFFIIFVLERLFFFNSEIPILITIIKYFGWTVLYLIMVKYFYDFSESFGKVTKSESLIWTFFLAIGGFGIIASVNGFLYLSPAGYFVIITIPAMQAELNHYYEKHCIRQREGVVYTV